MFHSLGREHLIKIVDVQLHRLKKLLQGKKIGLELTDAAKLYLGEAGYDPVYGARPLKRAIQRELQDPLANAILQGQVQEGQSVLVDANGDGLRFEAK